MTVLKASYQDQKWIIAPFWDLILFIGTPFVCLATMLPLRGFFSSETIAFYALSLFATGHHLPGFMRAYGDPELFRAYREKFLVAPLIVLGVVAYAQFFTLYGIFLMILLWELWHLFMQHYGIMRIYDAKNRIFSRFNARLDWLLSVCAFAAVVIYSPEYLHRILDQNHKAGLPFLPQGQTQGLKLVLLCVTLAVGATYLGNLAYRLVRGLQVSLPKVAVMATTLFIIYYAWIHIGDLIIGYAAFAVFHDIQYFAIVWVYNHNLVQRQPTTALLRKLFTTRTLPLVGLYMLLCFGYGSVNILEGFVTTSQAIKVIQVFVISSALLHYYYDGFIWKLRERKNQVNLEIGEGEPQPEERADDGPSGLLQQGGAFLREGGRLLAYFGVPVLLLSLFQLYWPADEAQARHKFTELFPDLPEARNNLGSFYARQGDLQRAKEEFGHALQLDPRAYDVHHNMGQALAREGRLDDAHQHYQKALLYKPEYVQSLNAQGMVFLQKGQMQAALQRFEAALEEFHYPPAYNNLGTTYLKMGDLDRAVAAFQEAVRLGGTEAKHHFNLGLAYQRQGKDRQALEAFGQAIRLQRFYPKAYISMALSYRSTFQLEKARQALQQLLILDPENETARRLLRQL